MGFGGILGWSDCLDIGKIGKGWMGERKGSNSHRKHQVSVVQWDIVLLREPIAQTLQRLP